MSRRKIDPIPILNQSHDSTFPTKLHNKHVTRFGNPATRLGARYVASDVEGLRQTAIDLEYLRLIIDGVPIINSMARRIEDRVRREQVLLDYSVATEGVPAKLKSLLEIGRKADVRKYLDQQQVSEYELFLLIHNCKQIGWSHRSKFPEYVPDHLLIIEKDRTDLHRGELKTISRKFASVMEERRRIHVHLFEKNSMWHCFYFSYDDLQDESASHWEHGPHLHYVNHLWPKYSSDDVWSLFDTRHTKISGAVHVRFSQFEYSALGTNPVDLAFPPHFGYQPMLMVFDARTRSNPNRDPIPTAQVATRGFWSFDISLRPD
jgi:hypothetical protein